MNGGVTAWSLSPVNPTEQQDEEFPVNPTEQQDEEFMLNSEAMPDAALQAPFGELTKTTSAAELDDPEVMAGFKARLQNLKVWQQE